METDKQIDVTPKPRRLRDRLPWWTFLIIFIVTGGLSYWGTTTFINPTFKLDKSYVAPFPDKPQHAYYHSGRQITNIPSDTPNIGGIDKTAVVNYPIIPLRKRDIKLVNDTYYVESKGVRHQLQTTESTELQLASKDTRYVAVVTDTAVTHRANLISYDYYQHNYVPADYVHARWHKLAYQTQVLQIGVALGIAIIVTLFTMICVYTPGLIFDAIFDLITF